MKEYQAVNQKPISMLRTLTELDQNIFIDTISCFIDQMKKILYTYPMQVEESLKFEDRISATSAVLQVQFLLLPALGHFM